MILTALELADLDAHALAEAPRECCGAVVARAGDRRWLRGRNAQDQLHALDPRRHPTDARHTFSLHPRDQLRLEGWRRAGFTAAVFYHSHVEAGAALSRRDREGALALLGRWPAAVHLVLAVRAGAIAERAAYRWDGRDFVRTEGGIV